MLGLEAQEQRLLASQLKEEVEMGVFESEKWKEIV
jgi:hypothetical protein